MELLERDAPLRELDVALKDAAAGEGRVALVSGEAGIGKTSLVERFTHEHRPTARALWGACDSLFTPRPLGPLHDIAAQTQGDLLARLTSESNRTAIFSIFLSELQHETTIVVIEDVHWADEATLDLLKYLGRRIQRTRALLIATYRDDETGPQHPLRLVLGDLATSTATRRLTLSPLSVDAVRTLVAKRPALPNTAPAASAARMQRSAPSLKKSAARSVRSIFRRRAFGWPARTRGTPALKAGCLLYVSARSKG